MKSVDLSACTADYNVTVCYGYCACDAYCGLIRYCVWCPTTSTCTNHDPKSIVPTCPHYQGYGAAYLDSAAATCPGVSQQQVTCQSVYMGLTLVNMNGGRAGVCSKTAPEDLKLLGVPTYHPYQSTR